MPLGAFKAALMGTAGVETETVVLLHDTDYSNAATAAITSGITSTYGEYIFKFYNMHPVTDDVMFSFQVNASSQSGYNETMTTTAFRAYNDEADSGAALEYYGDQDQAQGTAYQTLALNVGNDNDQTCVGTLHLFSPSNTTYVTHFYSRFNSYHKDDYSMELYTAGYVNVTAAITNIQFKMSSGNFDGTIKMWGVK